MNATLRTAAGALVVAGLIAGAAALQAARERQFLPPSAAEDALYVTSGTTLKRLSMGYSAVVADLYWIRAIQYYGGVKLRLENPGSAAATASASADYTLLHPLLDLTTTLDPHFNIAYRFGSIFLAEPVPGGAGRPDLAIALLQKGLEARPDKWEYMQDIGFVHYWWRHDYKSAAEWFDKASQVPGAPWFLRSLAATTLAEGGDRRSSRTMWLAIHESAEIEWLRTDAERRLLQLDALDFIDQVQRAVDGARAAGVNVNAGWAPLVRGGVLRGVPVDPRRTPLELDPAGKVRLSPQSPLFPLPEEPQRQFAPPS